MRTGFTKKTAHGINKTLSYGAFWLLEEAESRPNTKLSAHAEDKLRKLVLFNNGDIEPGKKAAKDRIEGIPMINMAMFLAQSSNLDCMYCYGECGTCGCVGSMDEQTAFQAVVCLLRQSGMKNNDPCGFLCWRAPPGPVHCISW